MITHVFNLPFGIVIDGVIQKEVEIVRLDGLDQEDMSEKKIATNGAKVITTVLSNKIKRIGSKVNPGEHIIKKMFTGDRDTCLVELRKLSFGDEMEFTFRCTDRNCKEKLDVLIDLNNIKNVEYDPENNPNHHTLDSGMFGMMEFDLPDGIECNGEVCKKGTITFPNGTIEENLAPLFRQNPGKAQTALLTACIKSVEGIKMINSRDVQSMSLRDREYLSKLIRDNSPGPKLYEDIICDSCMNEMKVPLELPYFFMSSTKE